MILDRKPNATAILAHSLEAVIPVAADCVRR